MARKLVNIIILILVVVIAILLFDWKRMNFSKDILSLKIIGPDKAAVGEEIEYVVEFQNNGDVRLENPILIFEYPQNSIPSQGDNLRVVKEAKDIGDIYPGQEKVFKFRARLFGKEGEVKQAKASLSYRPKNLKPTYISKTSCITTINSVPLTLDFDLPSKVEPGGEISFSLNYFSNIDYPLSNIGINIDYPSDFQVKDVSPSSLDNHHWTINSLNQTEGGKIDIDGLIQGDIGQQKIFKAELGIWQKGQFVVLKDVMRGVSLVEPSLEIDQTVNGSSHYQAVIGDSLHYEIRFINIGQKPFENLVATVKLNSDFFDLSTLHSNTGQYEEGDNSIIWRAQDIPEFRYLAPQDQAKIDFWVDVKKSDLPQNETNPVLSDQVIINQIRKEFKVKLSSRLGLIQNAYINDEVFSSPGPLPPKVGQKSLCTIIWRAKTDYNDLKNVRFKTILPNNVGLTGKIFPQDQADKISFDSQSRELTWDIGNLLASSTSSREKVIDFQLYFIPDENQKGQPVQLIGNGILRGEDAWTGKMIEATTSPITSLLIDKNQGITQ